jgi:hypothetical protein
MTFKCFLRTARDLDSSLFISDGLKLKYTLGPDKGRPAEEKALLLVETFFDGVEQAFLARKGYVLDVSFKVDLVVKFYEQKVKDEEGKTIKVLNKRALGLQVKSSAFGALKHEDLRFSRDWEFGFPECLTLAMGTNMVSQLVRLLRRKPNKRFFDALELARNLGGETWPEGIPGMKDLVVLGLAKPTKQGYVVRPTR